MEPQPRSAPLPAAAGSMPYVPALEVLARLRRDQVVVTTMGAAREWPKLSSHPLDFHYIPSAMGHAPMLGLGLALARPEREVIVLNGDGCMLMSLGCLVTIVASGARNYTLLVLDNGVYEVTGGQATPAADAAVDFALLARGAGFPTARAFDRQDDWQREAAATLALPGPRFIVLKVDRVADFLLEPPGPLAERLRRFREALAG